jgi:hypothetical protein
VPGLTPMAKSQTAWLGDGAEVLDP